MATKVGNEMGSGNRINEVPHSDKACPCILRSCVLSAEILCTIEKTLVFCN